MIELSSVSKTFLGKTRQQHVEALRDVSLSIKQGEIFGIIGYSGAGKSTLVRVINLLERPDLGRVRMGGQDLTAMNPRELRQARRKIGMIFQHFSLLPSRTVSGNIAFPLKYTGLSKEEIRAKVTTLLNLVELSDKASAYPSQLSGGQKQRVAIARALAADPQVLLCDEATSALDPETTEQILTLVSDLNRELGLTIVLITHEMDVVRRVCDRVAVLDAGRVVESGAVEDVFLHPASDTARRFVREADGEPAAGVDLAGRVVRLTFKGEATYKPVLGEVARATGVDYSILGGRIHRLRQTPYGQLTLALTGGDIDAAIARFQAGGVRVDPVVDEEAGR